MFIFGTVSLLSPFSTNPAWAGRQRQDAGSGIRTTGRRNPKAIIQTICSIASISQLHNTFFNQVMFGDVFVSTLATKKTSKKRQKSVRCLFLEKASQNQSCMFLVHFVGQRLQDHWSSPGNSSYDRCWRSWSHYLQRFCDTKAPLKLSMENHGFNPQQADETIPYVTD